MCRPKLRADGAGDDRKGGEDAVEAAKDDAL